MNADDRDQVRTYYTGLWIWNRLDKSRWNAAKVALAQQSRVKTSIEVDHIVAYALWQTKLAAWPEVLVTTDVEQQAIEIGDLKSRVNEIGNCMLLEKNFNISKNKYPLKDFLEGVHEFKDHQLEIPTWAEALDLDMAQVACGATTVDTLLTLFSVRSQKILADLERFIRGTINRIDLDD